MAGEGIPSAKRPPWRWQFSFRTLIVLVSLGCICLAIWTNRARQQYRAYQYFHDRGYAVRFARDQGIDQHDELELAKRIAEKSGFAIHFFESAIGATIYDAEGTKPRLDLAELNQFPHLRSVRLWGDEFDDESLAQLAASCSRLERIELHSSRVTDAGIRELRKLRHLRHLNLAGCEHVTAAGIRGLARLPLQTINVSNTGVSSAEFGELKLLFPDGVLGARDGFR